MSSLVSDRSTWVVKVLLPLTIFIMAAVLRVPHLSTIPDGFFTDEAALGYNAWSLMKTGRDEWGKFLPLTLRSFHDYKPAIYSYISIPFIAMFGLTETATRLPAALFGSFLPVITYFWLLSSLGKQHSTTNQASVVVTATLSALVICIAPWHWEVSRTAIEAGVALCMSMISILLLKSQRRKYLALGVLLALVTLYTYHTARIILPPILFLGALLNQFKYKRIVVSVSAMMLGLGLFLSLTGSSERYRQISIIHDEGRVARLGESIREDGGVAITPLLLTRLYHNKPVSILWDAAGSYITNTSLEFLFVGGVQPPRTAIPETGQFLLIFLPFFLVGILKMLREIPENQFQLWLLFWLLIAPVPAALTYAEIPHAYRTLFLLVPVAVLIGQGLVAVIQWLFALFNQYLPNYRYAAVGLMIVMIAAATAWNAGKAWHQYGRHQQVHQPWFRTSGYEQLVEYVNQLDNVGQRRIVITRAYMEPYIFFLFYNQVEPEQYQALAQKRLSRYELDVEHKTEWTMFGITFTTEKCPTQSYQVVASDTIFIGALGCEVPYGFKQTDTVAFADGVPMFVVTEPMTLEELEEYNQLYPNQVPTDFMKWRNEQQE